MHHPFLMAYIIDAANAIKETAQDNPVSTTFLIAIQLQLAGLTRKVRHIERKIFRKGKR